MTKFFDNIDTTLLGLFLLVIICASVWVVIIVLGSKDRETLTDFCKSMGYDGYEDTFKRHIQCCRTVIGETEFYEECEVFEMRE